MDITIFTDTPFGDDAAMKDFLFSNSQAHSLVAKTLEGLGTVINSQPISDMRSEKDWLLVHNEIHQEELAALGITQQSVDLSEVDLKDEAQYIEWMQQHAFMHQYVNDALGLV